MEPVPYVRIASGYTLLRLGISNLNNSNIQNISRASNSCGNPLFSWMFWILYTVFGEIFEQVLFSYNSNNQQSYENKTYPKISRVIEMIDQITSLSLTC